MSLTKVGPNCAMADCKAADYVPPRNPKGADFQFPDELPFSESGPLPCWLLRGGLGLLIRCHSRRNDADGSKEIGPIRRRPEQPLRCRLILLVEFFRWKR